MKFYSVPLLILVLLDFQSICARRQVSSRDWPEYRYEMQDDEPEYVVIPLPKLIWSCDFKQDDCNISNDFVVGPYFRLSNTQINGFPKQNMLLLNISQIESHPSGARLITPYFTSAKHQTKGINQFCVPSIESLKFIF